MVIEHVLNAPGSPYSINMVALGYRKTQSHTTSLPSHSSVTNVSPNTLVNVLTNPAFERLHRLYVSRCPVDEGKIKGVIF